MTTIAQLNARRKQAGLPLIRFNLRRLQPADVQDLRDAFAALYEISEIAVGDRRGYWAIARGHGYDEDLCHNDDRVFLPWHRAYVYVFEKALSAALQWKRKDPSLVLTLPYWDWTTFDPSTDADNGIPRVLDDATYPDANGVDQPNPLASARSMYRVVSEQLTGKQQYTERFPVQFRDNIAMLANDVASYMKLARFSVFSNNFSGGAHGAIHVLVGGEDPSGSLADKTGDMAQVTSAAYDPIFWFHHAMVDKVWFDWQTRHPSARISDHVLDSAIYGEFDGRDVIDAEHDLLYIYSDESVEAAVEVGGTLDATPADDPAPEPVPPPVTAAVAPVVAPQGDVLPIGEVSGAFERAQLDFHQLRPPRSSFEIRAFFNNPDATSKTPCDDPSFAGRLMLFGHGRCHGAPGHCNPKLEARDDYDQRHQHPLRFEKTKYAIDVTDALRRLVPRTGAPVRIDVTLVTLDVGGRPVARSSVKYRGVSLSTRT